MKKVVITGTAGLLGPYVVEHFLESGYEVLSVDINRPALPLTDHLIADTSNMGECYGILKGMDAVVHLAAVPNANTCTGEVTFKNNMMSTYNILDAADALGIKKAVIASSECAYGICTSKTGLAPQYVPMDEDHPCLPEEAYGLGKILGEEVARAVNRRANGMQIVSFRIGNVMTPAKYPNFHSFKDDPSKRVSILWSYIDARDIATACRLAVELDGLGAPVLNLAADDTSMDIKSCDLMKHAYPQVTDIRGPIDGYQTLLCNKKAKEMLGWQPTHFWRDNVK
ncbi:MAG: NAD(P)-dependent oxidoreductase [Defluviitaleaceae bacterium]|nr:NAD(P)-dependent oxidoreductase [Defluviitaleaceae bacterium]